ncbi:ABC transporter substrate-binding protein [Wenzhouxiangella limi]|uniref:Extracellular solute-binding protein n=1 Tax=Wenzhouxiangella limi TaxID=2707351 RepID=A0A845VG29_9GAMM|nr:extracellular solute-binding protein [Wenzhouxiangella limi]NDY96169.1 extracellular solute-binding protein [Wenzhouxiangella limi]
MAGKATLESSVDITRRDLLGGIAAIGAGALFPSIIRARDRKVTLRVLGTHVTLQEPIRRQAEQDLGIDIEFEPGGSAQVLLRATTNPESFDLYEQWSDSTRVLWRADAIQSIDTRRLKYWEEINPLSKTGRISPGASPGAGDVPNTILYVQPDGRLGPEPSREISFLPYVHNVDSFGYNSDVIAVGEPYVEESWGWLLDPKHSGRVALVNAPSIGIFDLALAARARGLIDFADIGAMTADEVDALFEIAIDYKLNNHFRAFWRSVPDSADLMLSGDVHIASMFSPGVTMVRSAGLPCLYAAPREGYRAWHGVMCMSRACSGEQQDAAYAFMNWWLSGWAGAFIARQGYYISNPERSRPFMESDEWGYWYEGLPAERPMPGPDGRIAVEPGEVRRGGSYVERFENIAVWNTVMPTYDRTVRRWSELVLA